MANKKSAPIIGILNKRVYEQDGNIVAEGSCVTKLTGKKEHIDTDLIRINIPLKENAAEIRFGSRFGIKLPGGLSINRFLLTIPISAAKEFDIQNRLIPVYNGKYFGRFLYDLKDLKRGRNKNSKVIINDGIAMYFRQTKFNSMDLTVRDANQYDTAEGQKRLARAQKESRRLDDDIVLMYEKNCSRYEESASVLYERLIDKGYENVYYIVDTSIPAVQNLEDKYKRNLIEKDSNRHLEYFFACKRFISSETIDHALQLRIANKAVQDKINGKGLSYVFLQHGVMYMVSLNSKLRSGFRKKSGYKLHRTVVSSETEARHFIDLAGMRKEDLYITGLAKFDECYRYDNADKIVIMPTWRRWETNQGKDSIEKTGYFKMIKLMYEAVPDDKKDKVVILPHPLMAERFVGETEALGGRILFTDSYDEVLRQCNVLVTDYSSIAYDAFYRGANVVFYWKEKDECMEHYGEGAHLMLNEENCFGPICMDKKSMQAAIEEAYGRPQSEKYSERYRHIVEFHDGRNSDRIIEKMIEDGMIEGR